MSVVPLVAEIPNDPIPMKWHDAWYYDYYEFPDISHNVTKHRGVGRTNGSSSITTIRPSSSARNTSCTTWRRTRRSGTGTRQPPGHAGHRQGASTEDGGTPQAGWRQRREMRHVTAQRATARAGRPWTSSHRAAGLSMTWSGWLARKRCSVWKPQVTAAEATRASRAASISRTSSSPT